MDTSEDRTMSESVARALGTDNLTGPMGKKTRRKKVEEPPANEDPREELRRLVREHKALVHKARAFEASVSDRTIRATGETLKRVVVGSGQEARVAGFANPLDVRCPRCTSEAKTPCYSVGPDSYSRGAPLNRCHPERYAAAKSSQSLAKPATTLKSAVPEDVRVEVTAVVESMRKRADLLESKMLRQLKQIPIYRLFLSRVFGVGPVVAAYLVSEIDIRRCEKVSNLRRYCGLAVIDGRLERPRIGQKLAYNAELRTRLYQAFSAMWKNAAKVSKDAPHGKTSKYLDVWRGYRHRMSHHERFDAEHNRLAGFDGAPDRPGAKALIHAAGWHKAADVLVEDLYIVWRAIEGLPVWPSYHAAKLGYGHGGTIVRNEPKMLTVEEALAVVGDPGGKALE